MTTPAWSGGTLYPNGSIVRPTAPSAPGPAAISNPTFDAGTTGWTLTGVAAWSAANGFTTPGCVEMTSGVGTVYLTAYTATTPGQTVTASCMIATPNGSAGSGGDINIVWYDAANVQVGPQSQGNTVNRAGGTGYRQSTVTDSCPAGAVKYKIGADVQTAGSGAIVRVDNFTTSVSGGAANDFVYRATQPGVGTSAASEPVWPTILGGSVVDGTVTWEAVYASRITYVAEPILKSGATEPTWPIGVGTVVSDGTILWTTGSRQVTEAPNSKIVVIGASKVFAGDDDIIRYSATVNPLDWTSTDDAGYLPFGLQNYGSNPVAAMGLYRGNLIAFNSESFQQWQIDPDPANMALLDAVPIGSTWHKALSPVANDLFFLAAEGVRTVGIAGGSTNLQAGDAGMPIDPLVRAATIAVTQAAYAEPLGTYFPSMGQYLLAYPEQPPPALSLSGPLPGATQYMPYTGSLDIHNAIGSVVIVSFTGPDDMTVEVVGGDVVIEWPMTPDPTSTVVTVSIQDSAGFAYEFSGTVPISAAPEFSLEGSLPDVSVGADYSEPLSIVNAIGAVTCTNIAGTNIPPGTQGVVVGSDLFIEWSDTPAVTPITFTDITVEDSVGREAHWSGSVTVNMAGISWIWGPCGATGAPGEAGSTHYRRTTNPNDWSAAPRALPNNGITRLSAANGALFGHANSPFSAVSFDDGNSWTSVTGSLDTNVAVSWNGRYYFCGGLRSADGVTWEAVPNLPFAVNVGIARVSDGAYFIIRSSPTQVAFTLDDGASWTVRAAGPWSSIGVVIETNGTRIWTSINNQGYPTDDLGATWGASFTAPSVLNNVHHAGDVLMYRTNTSPAGAWRRRDPAASGSQVSLFNNTVTTANAHVQMAGDGDDTWVYVDKTAANTWQIKVSTDLGATFGPAVATVGGTGCYVVYTGKPDP